MTVNEVNKIFVDLVRTYTNATTSECDIYEVPNKNKAYMYIGTMIGLKEFRDAVCRKICHEICLEQETDPEETIREPIILKEGEVDE